MKILAKLSYETLYLIFSTFSKITELIYVVVCAIDKWLMEHEK